MDIKEQEQQEKKVSFSSQVKEELSKQMSSARHCQIAEIAGFLGLSGEVKGEQGQETEIVVRTENAFVARKYFTLLEKTFNISVAIYIHQNSYLAKSKVYNMYISELSDVQRVLKATNHNALIQKKCCKRAFLRGCFLASGSISAPQISYHLEIACKQEEVAARIKHIFMDFDIDAKIVHRKKQFVVYLKEGNQIVDTLGLMEANLALMELENIRIVKDVRNSINRQCNCETANLNKTILAAVKQVEDIKYIEQHMGFASLTPALSQMAEIRLMYPEASLAELGSLMNPPVGKSGVNHRLRKLSEIAKELRGSKEESYYD